MQTVAYTSWCPLLYILCLFLYTYKISYTGIPYLQSGKLCQALGGLSQFLVGSVRPCRAPSGPIGLFDSLLCTFRLCHALSDSVGPCQALSVTVGLSWALSIYVGFFWALSSSVWSCQALSGSVEICNAQSSGVRPCQAL